LCAAQKLVNRFNCLRSVHEKCETVKTVNRNSMRAGTPKLKLGENETDFYTRNW